MVAAGSVAAAQEPVNSARIPTKMDISAQETAPYRRAWPNSDPCFWPCFTVSESPRVEMRLVEIDPNIRRTIWIGAEENGGRKAKK